MTSLPAELVALIIPDRATSTNLALVNKYYHSIVTPLLYREVTLEGSRVLKAFSETMVTGRSILSKSPTSPSITYWPLIFDQKPDPKHDLMTTVIMQHLMQVQNLTRLGLGTWVVLTHCLLKGSLYPFKLRRLDMRPINDAAFFQFLITQLEIKEITLPQPIGQTHWARSGGVIPTPLQPDILPKLHYIKSDEYGVSVMVPNHPVINVQICEPYSTVWFNKFVAQSSMPLESLVECIDILEYPWESGIVSQCFSSLEFCWPSLTRYSLRILLDEEDLQGSLLLFLKGKNTPSHGFDALRKDLSKFSVLRKFHLSSYSLEQHDLTPEFCETAPELSRFDVWQESCPKLVEVTLFGITLKKA